MRRPLDALRSALIEREAARRADMPLSDFRRRAAWYRRAFLRAAGRDVDAIAAEQSVQLGATDEVDVTMIAVAL